jgi:hypothetical protein
MMVVSSEMGDDSTTAGVEPATSPLASPAAGGGSGTPGSGSPAAAAAAAPTISASADPSATSSSLPHTPLSLELEQRVRERLAAVTSPEVASSIVVRTVSSLKKTISVPAEVRAVFTATPPDTDVLLRTLASSSAVAAMAVESVGGGSSGGGGSAAAGAHGAQSSASSPPSAAASSAPAPYVAPRAPGGTILAPVVNAYAEAYTYRQRVILLWQRLDGVDVCLFALYVQEYGADCPPPNSGKVYIAYLDSVRYLRPLVARTPVYHELLAAYLGNARARGYNSAYIWACPPQVRAAAP